MTDRTREEILHTQIRMDVEGMLADQFTEAELTIMEDLLAERVAVRMDEDPDFSYSTGDRPGFRMDRAPAEWLEIGKDETFDGKPVEAGKMYLNFWNHDCDIYEVTGVEDLKEHFRHSLRYGFYLSSYREDGAPATITMEHFINECSLDLECPAL